MAKVGKIKFYGEIYRWNGKGAASFSDRVAELAKDSSSILMDMHCYGGEVFEANVNCITIENSPVDFDIDVVGVAASMGAIMLQSARKRRIVANGFVMVHCPSGGAWGNAAKHREAADLLEKMQNNFKKALAAATGRPEADFEAWMDGGDHWFTAEEALAEKLVDEIIPAKVKIKDLDKVKAAELGAEAVHGLFSAHLDNKQKPKIKDNMELKAMAVALGLPEDATEADVLLKTRQNAEAVTRLKQEKADKAANKQQSDMAVALGLPATATVEEITAKQQENAQELEQLRQDKQTRETAEATAQAAADKTMLDTAVADGRINADARPGWEGMLKADRDNALALFPKARNPIHEELNGGGDKGYVPGALFDKKFQEIDEKNK